jgi:hypothetical protein
MVKFKAVYNILEHSSVEEFLASCPTADKL